MPLIRVSSTLEQAFTSSQDQDVCQNALAVDQR